MQTIPVARYVFCILSRLYGVLHALTLGAYAYACTRMCKQRCMFVHHSLSLSLSACLSFSFILLTYLCICIHKFISKYINKCIYIYVLLYIYCMYACVCTYAINKQAYIHTHTPLYIYIHIYIYIPGTSIDDFLLVVLVFRCFWAFRLFLGVVACICGCFAGFFTGVLAGFCGRCAAAGHLR